MDGEQAFSFINTNSLLFILLIELAIISMILIALLFSSARHIALEKKQINEKQKISRILINLIESKVHVKDAIDLLQVSSLEFLLKQLQVFDQRFTSTDWKKIKLKIASHYLLPKARHLAGSSSWLERNFSAHCFVLVPQHEDIERIHALVDDPIFMVSSVAAEASLKLELEEGMLKIIHHMSKHEGFSYDYYKSLILQHMTAKNFIHLQKIASEKKEDPIHLVCLHLLVAKGLFFSHPFLWEDIQSPNPAIRLAALKVFARHPQRSMYDIFLKCLDEVDPDFRLEGIKGIEFFPSEKVYKKLKKYLLDSNWKVRLEAAKVLKKLAPEILYSQNPIQNIKAYEVAQYALNFY